MKNIRKFDDLLVIKYERKYKERKIKKYYLFLDLIEKKVKEKNVYL